MHVESVASGADDQDFDMFLRGEEEEHKVEPTAAPPTPEEVYAGLPRVWSGILSMPLDSTIPQETHVYARQIGGRTLEPDSLLWRTLFPSETLRIDGRVAVNNSSQYLLQARMNSARELIAVTFSPESEPDKHKFGQLLDFLIRKDRHGLIFPWGNRGREWGRELYVIPLLSTYPLPDYIELLDDLRLPKERKENCLVGMWVLTRGKLSPPPQHAPQHQAPPVVPGLSQDGGAQQAPPLPFNMPDIAGLSRSLMSGLGGPPPASSGPPAISPASLPLPSSIAQNISPALAAEVASLTPEQVQIMLQTLRSSLGPNISIPSTPAHPGPSSASPYRPPQPPPQPPFPQSQPPMPWPQFAPNMPLPIPQPPPPVPPQHERYEERGPDIACAASDRPP
ncbi:hypothetical protein EWM64_g8619 [Hericium alpestre]|uniref:Spen paralogue and orthologue SPOC C-terminal domain-containing protein n=1 Tax=Hericium alpestre TaxID=135208 RepID=A0A4Y9ZMA0_9AGAM|nr:hypothetical protein EWM64_g8619 [Hericium alpestre]